MTTINTGAELKRELMKVHKMTADGFAKILKKLAFDGFREVMLRSAVDTGFLRSKWSVVVDTRPADNVERNPAEGDELSFNDAPMPSISVKGNSIVTIYNNTEYVIHLENGTATNRAQPMIEPTYQMLLAIAERLTTLLSKKILNV